MEYVPDREGSGDLYTQEQLHTSIIKEPYECRKALNDTMNEAAVSCVKFTRFYAIGLGVQYVSARCGTQI